MLQKAAEMRLFYFKTSQLRYRSASAPLLLRSGNFCYVCIGENHQGTCIQPAGVQIVFL